MRLRMSAPIVAVALLSGCPQSSPPPHASGGPGTANTAPVHTRAVAPAMPVESKAPADSPYVDMKKGQVWIVKKASHVVAGGDVI
ncbi:hypothetical protein HY251_15550, partial [bacterium]|nr:hypothetical protein [bacterium]